MPEPALADVSLVLGFGLGCRLLGFSLASSADSHGTLAMAGFGFLTGGHTVFRHPACRKRLMQAPA